MDDDEDFDFDIDDAEFLEIATQAEQQLTGQTSSIATTAPLAAPAPAQDTEPLFLPGNFDDDDDDPSSTAPPTAAPRLSLATQAPGNRQTTLFGSVRPAPAPEARTQNTRHNWPLVAQKPEAPTHHKLDLEAAKTWVYPINVSFRDYQFNIVRRALLTNVLCALPTGWFFT